VEGERRKGEEKGIVGDNCLLTPNTACSAMWLWDYRKPLVIKGTVTFDPRLIPNQSVTAETPAFWATGSCSRNDRSDSGTEPLVR
jgi:hypothetical protein